MLAAAMVFVTGSAGAGCVSLVAWAPQVPPVNIAWRMPNGIHRIDVPMRGYRHAPGCEHSRTRPAGVVDRSPPGGSAANRVGI